MIGIRAAVVADAHTLADLRWEFRDAQNPAIEPRTAFVARCAVWMRRELQDGGAWRAWVAVDDDVIVGQVWLQIVPKIPNPVAEREQLAYLSNLYVKPSARGGTGRRLLEIALDVCRTNMVDRVVLWPSPRSVTLYLRHGFSKDGDVMELKLG
jgi:ribosomal protein S18 acetylase RimI-like enzyme